MFGAVQNVVVLALWVVLLALKGFAFVDCLRAPSAVFPSIGRQTKILWLVLTGLALLTVSAGVPGVTGVTGVEAQSVVHPAVGLTGLMPPDGS